MSCPEVRPRSHAVAPLVGLAVVMALDVISSLRSWPIPVGGVLDEPAHLLTAWLLLGAFAVRSASRVQLWALAGAVAIDIDHVPLYFWGEPVAASGGRPVTHSLATVAVLLGMATVARLRPAVVGLAVGVLLHMVRDLATGPGVPLLWPLSGASVEVRYPWYVAVLTIAAAVALRARRRSGVVSG
jgi:inner membrane protein